MPHHTPVDDDPESEGRPDPLARLLNAAQAIEDLRDVFAAEEPLDVMAGRVADTALAAIPYADAITITVLSWPESRTAACTDEEVLILDDEQYASGRGPCLEAAMQRTPLRAIVDEDRQRWPEFAEVAQRAGIRASLSVPLVIEGADSEQELAGSLNIYSRTATAFDQFDAELMRLYGVAAGQAITNSGRWQKARETVAQLETALETALTSRTEVDMAKGALIALHGCDASEALAHLMDESRRRGLTLPDVARQLLNRMQMTAYSQRY
jgi:GAF domain-containing protein